VEEKCCPDKQGQCSGGINFSVFFKYVLGLFLLIIGGWFILKYWNQLVLIFQGSIGLFLIVAGSIVLAVAK